MYRTIGKPILTTVLLFGLSSLAHANLIPASWSESRTFNQQIPPAYTYSHDLSTDGFRPLVDVILDYELSIDLYDDGGFLDRFEIAVVDVPGILGDRYFFTGLGGEEGSGTSLLGFLELNFLGTLTITIDSVEIDPLFGRSYIGDFILGSSTLTADGLSRIPEPGSLALLGIGLACAGLLRRRRQS